jgi:hypothetical protein
MRIVLHEIVPRRLWTTPEIADFEYDIGRGDGTLFEL